MCELSWQILKQLWKYKKELKILKPQKIRDKTNKRSWQEKLKKLANQFIHQKWLSLLPILNRFG
jgi:hypothetical protein